ncbi:MAG: L,D-transpeptidase family protein [Hyphomicrobiaceae bacterium]
MKNETRARRRYQSWKDWILFHRLVIGILAQWLGALLATAILVAPATGWAQKGQAWILIDTQALTLTVFSAEKHVLVRFHNISIGSGGAAESHRRGDETTPQGIFHVTWVDRHSRFGTFYGLDYPNAKIARIAYFEGIISEAEFDSIMQALRHHRTPPQNTALGGQLGIHGIGRGDPAVQHVVNWTDGCVALSNRDIRLLSRWVQVGTRVVIR